MLGNKSKIRVNKDGTTSWQLRYMSGGKQHRKTVRTKTEREADRALQDFVRSIDAGKIDWTKIPWPDLCTQWLEQYSKREHKRSTYQNNRRKIEKRIRGAWTKPASEITKIDVQKWVNETAEEDNLSGKTMRNLYTLISVIFRWGVQMDLISSSPCEYITLPKQERKEAEHLTEEELRELLEMMNEEPLKYQVVFYLGVFAGMRKGEILGLHTSDLDLKTGEYRVINNRQILDGGGSYEDSPKTHAGERTGRLPKVATSKISEYLEEKSTCKEGYGDKWVESPYLITHEDGTPLSPQATADWVLRFRKKHPEAPYFSLHTLRHTHASLLRHLGAGMDEIQKRLGHADKATTSRIYVHLFEEYSEADKRLADEIDAFMANDTDK